MARTLSASIPNHDGGAKLDDRDTGVAQDVTDFVSAAEVRGQRRAGISQPSEVDDASQAGRPSRGPERSRGGPVRFGERTTARHRVNQVVGGVHPLHRSSERARIHHITQDDFGPPAGADPACVPHQTAPGRARCGQGSKQLATDVAGRASQQKQVALRDTRHGVFPTAPDGRCGQPSQPSSFGYRGAPRAPSPPPELSDARIASHVSRGPISPRRDSGENRDEPRRAGRCRPSGHFPRLSGKDSSGCTPAPVSGGRRAVPVPLPGRV